MNAEKLRAGIFSLRTRRFGSVAECMVQRLLKYGKAKNLFHDLFDEEGRRRIEVKFSTVQQKADRTVTVDTVLKCIEDAIEERKPVPFSDWKSYKFDCNIQQVKRKEFDVLYYGLFFSDCIKIFKLESKEIKEKKLGGLIGYSDKQHKGNVGEGQFHVTHKNLQFHLDHYLHKTLTYDQLLKLLAVVSLKK